MIELSDRALKKLHGFEAGLDPERLHDARPRPRVIGYGEVTTTFAFEDADLAGVAFKRMALFDDEAELRRLLRLHRQYTDRLNRLGVRTPDDGSAVIEGRDGKPVLYLLQERLGEEQLGHRLIHHVPVKGAMALLRAVLRQQALVFHYNLSAPGDAAEPHLGFDGQLSNFALLNPEAVGRSPESIALMYVDTSTPLMQIDGNEQLDVDLFLRVVPTVSVWLVRRFFLDQVVARYYDPRSVAVDLLANLHKERRPDLISLFLPEVNALLAEAFEGFAPIARDEIDRYYGEDARIWRVMLALRRFERRVTTRLLGRTYPHILPGPTER